MGVATVWLESGDGRRWPVAATCSLGRSATNDIIIDDGKVSRRHALVHKQDDAEYWVIDLGSGNGTYLNGRRVIQPTRLSNGDALQVGDHSLSFHQITARSISDPRGSQISAQTIISIKDVPCWLLVADIKGSSDMAARLSSTEMAMQVGRWMGSCKEIVDGHGGAINKYLGDGFLAFWMAEAIETTQIVSAVRALKTLQADTTSPRFRLALHYGTVAFGGAASHGEDSLSGVDVVIAFRMEKIASELACDLLASEQARQQLSGSFTLRDLGSHSVAGITGPARRFYAVS
ncbi:MAG: FHA domain-containing protein [Hyphomicrobiaceae bacterium]|jgi:adenylate cyclase